MQRRLGTGIMPTTFTPKTAKDPNSISRLRNGRLRFDHISDKFFTNFILANDGLGCVILVKLADSRTILDGGCIAIVEHRRRLIQDAAAMEDEMAQDTSMESEFEDQYLRMCEELPPDFEVVEGQDFEYRKMGTFLNGFLYDVITHGKYSRRVGGTKTVTLKVKQ